MQKIETLFCRDPKTGLVVDQIREGLAWVRTSKRLIVRRKLDGIACMIDGGVLYKRVQVADGERTPITFRQTARDVIRNISYGWVIVYPSDPENQYFSEAFNFLETWEKKDGTYELIGPGINGNPEKRINRLLVNHKDAAQYKDVPLSFQGMKDWLAGKDIEGLVFTEGFTGQMAKIKLEDFGFKRPQPISRAYARRQAALQDMFKKGDRNNDSD